MSRAFLMGSAATLARNFSLLFGRHGSESASFFAFCSHLVFLRVPVGNCVGLNSIKLRATVRSGWRLQTPENPGV
jgi:hypothetical protein